MDIREGPLLEGSPSRIRTVLLGYLSLTKPRVIELLLVTTIPAMLLAHRGSVDPLLILNTLVGGLLAAAGANTLNCVADADIDKKMKRTEGRPLARDSVPRSHAFVFGLALSVASFFWLWWTTNMLSAHLAGATIAFYVLVYTLLLKRRTSQNVVWGGAAGCMPVMIGWSAVTGTIAWPALVMFAIIFFWTPPHTWALAMRYKDDYKAAGVPMLPVVATEREVTKQILIYTWLTVAATLGLALATGWLYASVALVAGTWFLAMAHQLYAGVRRGEPIKPLRLFLQSNNYLASRVLCVGGRFGTRPADAAYPLSVPTRVTPDNFARAESDLYFGNLVQQGAFGAFFHFRELSPIDHQLVIRINRDTLYSGAVFDLDAGEVAITLPDSAGRFMSMQVIDEDHYTHEVVYDAGRHVIGREQIGTR